MSEPPQMFKSVLGTFIGNVQAIRVFNEQIGRVADEHDRTVMQQFVDRLHDLLPEMKDIEGSVVFVPKTDEIEDDDTAGADTQAAEESVGETRLAVDPETLRSVMKAMSSLGKRAPGQGPLLRRGALTALTSFLEVLISDLIQIYYSMYPAALPADTRKLSLAELREQGSIEDAVKYLVSREVDGVLYEGLDDQLNYFSKQLKVNLGPLEGEREALVEVFQRRNLLIHNDGVVNRHYMSKVTPELIEKYQAELGTTIVVTENYLTAAIDSIYVTGLALVQLCWRHWHKASTEQADSVVNDRLYQTLLDDRFDLTCRMADRFKGIRFANDDLARRATINHAIALKELERPEEMEAVLSRKDWSACGLGFKIALAALKNEEESFYELLPRAVVAKELLQWHLEEWPLFAHQRSTERFSEAIAGHFGDGRAGRADG